MEAPSRDAYEPRVSASILSNLRSSAPQPPFATHHASPTLRTSAMTYGALVGQNEPGKGVLPGPSSCPSSPYQPQPPFHINPLSATQHPAAVQRNTSLADRTSAQPARPPFHVKPLSAAQNPNAVGWHPSMADRADAQTAWQPGEEHLNGSSTRHLSVPSAEPWAHRSCDGIGEGTGMAVSLVPDQWQRSSQTGRPRQPFEAACRASSSGSQQHQPQMDGRMAAEPNGTGYGGRGGRSSKETQSNHAPWLHSSQEPADATSQLETYLQDRPLQAGSTGPDSGDPTSHATSFQDGRQQPHLSQSQPGRPAWMTPSWHPADLSSYGDELTQPGGHQLQPRHQQQQHRTRHAQQHVQPSTGGAGPEDLNACDLSTGGSQMDSLGRQARAMQRGAKSRSGSGGSASDASLQQSNGWCHAKPDASGHASHDSQADSDKGQSAAWRIKARAPAWQPTPPEAAQKLLHGRPYATEHSAQV